jgi:hypothetical protein
MRSPAGEPERSWSRMSDCAAAGDAASASVRATSIRLVMRDMSGSRVKRWVLSARLRHRSIRLPPRTNSSRRSGRWLSLDQRGRGTSRFAAVRHAPRSCRRSRCCCWSRSTGPILVMRMWRTLKLHTPPQDSRGCIDEPGRGDGCEFNSHLQGAGPLAPARPFFRIAQKAFELPRPCGDRGTAAPGPGDHATHVWDPRHNYPSCGCRPDTGAAGAHPGGGPA